MAKNAQWKTTSAAAAALKVSPETLRKYRRRGDFTLGIHYRFLGGKKRKVPRIQWNLALLEREFSSVPAD